jgi:NADH:ubiquinone oxidoreductase subunit K
MNEEIGNPNDKSAGDLGREAMSFAGHTLLAVLVLAVIVFAISLTGAQIDQNGPKILGTALAFLGPMAIGFVVAKAKHDPVAGYVWLAGLLTFSIVCVWVLDLPTGPGLCEKCGAVEKLYRTFFDINNGSGLMAGDGLLVGTWIPLSMIGYAVGAKLGLD